MQTDPVRTRTRILTGATFFTWPLVAIGAVLWVANDRSWASFGFSVPDGWRWWTAIALVLLIVGYYTWGMATVVRSADARASIRQQSAPSPRSCRRRGQTWSCWEACR